jgi:hypothetical protein
MRGLKLTAIRGAKILGAFNREKRFTSKHVCWGEWKSGSGHATAEVDGRVVLQTELTTERRTLNRRTCSLHYGRGKAIQQARDFSAPFRCHTLPCRSPQTDLSNKPHAWSFVAPAFRQCSAASIPPDTSGHPSPLAVATIACGTVSPRRAAERMNLR